MSYAMEAAHDRVAKLAGGGLDLVTFWRECAAAIARAVPHMQTPCWFTLDPASLLVTSHYQTELAEIRGDFLAFEYYEDDFLKLADVARSKRGAGTIYEATGGDPSRSRGWKQFVEPYGGDQELLVALRSKGGTAWGVVGLYREPGQPEFEAREIEFMRALAPYLATGAQQGLLVGEASDPEGPESPGLAVLNEDWSLESLTPGTERWLEELPGGDWEQGGRLPAALLSVAGRALRTAENESAPGEVAYARVVSKSGRWLVLHGASMLGSGARRVAVIIEPAHPARISPLLMEAYHLSNREQEVARLVLRGDSTIQIAEALFVSPHTVQQHLKAVFEKTGVRSRRDLVGKVFFAHYEPRVRDNEKRVLAEALVRGGPVPGKLHRPSTAAVREVT